MFGNQERELGVEGRIYFSRIIKRYYTCAVIKNINKDYVTQIFDKIKSFCKKVLIKKGKKLHIRTFFRYSFKNSAAKINFFQYDDKKCLIFYGLKE